ncbi:MAG: DeoR/GlpR transcriptional regulator [Actinobacteria bacterium]|nr:DeoR/GlpR transcriptional regulator [Actinomycetota bacterium]
MPSRPADAALRGERMASILVELRKHGEVHVTELAETFGVSQATLRRDLAILEDQGLCKRRYGGAVPTDSSTELPVAYRDRRSKAEKRAVAETAAKLLPRGPQTVGFTGGSTTSEIARVLSSRVDLVVVTNALNIAAEMAAKPRIRVVVSGGVARSQSTELVGPWAEAALAQATIGTAYVGVDGLDIDGGLTTHDPVEARTNAVLLEQAGRVIVVADASKFGRVLPGRIGGVQAADVVVTDSGADPTVLEDLRARGIQVVIASPA